MDNKSIQRKRMLKYFVEATAKIIDTEGIDAVTVKKVSDLAGYNSTTLYNYFDNLDHLIFFTSLRHLKAYTQDLPNYVQDRKNSIEIYLLVWKCFAKHCYSQPVFYHDFFFGKYGKISVEETVKLYYTIFAEEMPLEARAYMKMLIENDLPTRDLILLRQVSLDNYISADNLKDISEASVLLFQGMLDRILYNHNNITVEEAVSTTIKQIKRTMCVNGVSTQMIQRLHEI